MVFRLKSRNIFFYIFIRKTNKQTVYYFSKKYVHMSYKKTRANGIIRRVVKVILPTAEEFESCAVDLRPIFCNPGWVEAIPLTFHHSLRDTKGDAGFRPKNLPVLFLMQSVRSAGETVYSVITWRGMKQGKSNKKYAAVYLQD